jgi:quercetin dioxygenase-like cupin family protein
MTSKLKRIWRILFGSYKEQKSNIASIEMANQQMLSAYVKSSEKYVFEHQLGNALFIGWDIIKNIPPDTYIQVAPGIYDRRLNSISDLKGTQELRFKKRLSKVNFDRYLVLLVRYERDGEFNGHYHPFPEIILALDGQYSGMLDGKIYSAGEEQIIPPWTVHTFKPVTDGFACILIPKI